MKADNSNIGPKLLVRRHFLREFHRDDPARVLDCFAGEGVLWRILRSEFNVDSYVGIDQKRKRGLIAADSLRILRAGKYTENVIDLDAYGSPWEHFDQVVKKCHHSVTVFLTYGFRNVSAVMPISACAIPKILSEAAGLNRFSVSVPPSLATFAAPLAIRYFLGRASQTFNIKKAYQAEPHTNAFYYGVRLEKK